MRKALGVVVVIVFAGLLCTSLLTIFTGNAATDGYLHSESMQYPYYTVY